MEPNLENKVDIEHFKLDEENISTDSENSFSSKDELCDDILNYSHEDAYDSFDEYNEACNKFNNLNEQDKIICIELMNNNKIYINYYDNWTIRDLLIAALKHKEFQKLYNKRFQFSNPNLFSKAFDLKLIIYRSIDEIESKIDLNIKIEDLEKLNLIKSHKFPFLYLSDERKYDEDPTFNSEYQSLINSKSFNILHDIDSVYIYRLPRMPIAYYPRTWSQDCTRVYTANKKCVNTFSKLNLDPLISEEGKAIDWFIYDDESLNFLMKMENVELEHDRNIKIFRDQIYFHDKLPFMLLSNKEFKYIYLSILINQDIIMKIDVQLTTTGFEILNKVNNKLKNVHPSLMFDSGNKCLKVHSLSDYYINLDEAIGLSSYVSDCIKNATIPRFILIDNPLKEKISGNLTRRRSSSHDDLTSTRLQLHSSINQNEIIRVQSKDKPTLFTKRTIVSRNDSNSNTPVTLFDRHCNKKETRIETNRMNSNTFTGNLKLRADIFKIATFNPGLMTFSSFKGLRRKATNEEMYLNEDFSNKKSDEDILNFNKILFRSYESRTKIEKEKKFSIAQNLTVDIDRLMKDSRSRSKGIRERPSISSSPAKRGEQGQNISAITKENFQITKCFKELRSNIPIKTIYKRFNFKLHLLKLQENFIKVFNFHSQISNTIPLEIDVQLYTGNELLTKRKPITWKGISSGTVVALIREDIEYDLKYSDLPLYTNLVIKVKSFFKNTRTLKHQKPVEKKVIAWGNFKLFDHLKRLKTGIHKTSLLDNKFSDDSYFISTEKSSKGVGEIFIEFETFMQPVVNEQTIYNDDSNDIPMDVNISIDDKRRIEQICSKSPFVLLSPEEKDILWKNRYVLAGDPKYLPKLLSCIDKKEVSQLREIKKLIRLTKKSTPIQAMELLSGNYLDESIREYAVNSLQQVSYMEINEYLSQLVQCLKYESYHDSPLASYLLKLAIKHPLKIGHQLFWNLKSEMHNENIRQRFGLYLEVFLLKIGHELRSVFEDETWLINKLLKLSDIGFIKDKTREEIQEILHEKLNQLNEEFSNKEISIPLNYKLKVKGLIVDKCKIMKSKKKPLWLVFKNADVYGEDIYVMFKKGDDLRQDIITLQLFRIMQNLWYSEGIKLKMSLYNVISTGYYQGMLQIVTNAETLATIQKSFGGITMGFSDKPLKYWMSKNLQGVNEVESVDNFLLSCAAYCVATFVLGIGDRHNDNIMIKNNGEIFHIDFGHFLGHFKYKFGIKRERAPFVFTSEFCHVLGGDKSPNFAKFKEICIAAYKVLRRNTDMFVTLLRSMICTGIPELTNSSINFLEYSLALDKNDDEAEEFILSKLDKSIHSLSTKINFALHILANK